MTDIAFVRWIPSSQLQNKQLVGEGEFGKVYKANYKGNDVALKVSKRRKDDDDLFKELQFLMHFRHENVIGCYGVSNVILHDQPKLVMVLEYARWNLYDVMPKVDPVRITKGLAAGMKYLHSQGVIYRDLKPDNVLVTKHGYARVADFGLATVYRENFRMTEGTGTIEYMAPEVRSRSGSVSESQQGLLYSYPVDVFSFGKLLEEMQRQNERTPPSLVRLSRKCVEADPGSRPTFADIVKELDGESSLSGESTISCSRSSISFISFSPVSSASDSGSGFDHAERDWERRKARAKGGQSLKRRKKKKKKRRRRRGASFNNSGGVPSSVLDTLNSEGFRSSRGRRRRRRRKKNSKHSKKKGKRKRRAASGSSSPPAPSTPQASNATQEPSTGGGGMLSSFAARLFGRNRTSPGTEAAMVSKQQESESASDGDAPGAVNTVFASEHDDDEQANSSSTGTKTLTTSSFTDDDTTSNHYGKPASEIRTRKRRRRRS